MTPTKVWSMLHHTLTLEHLVVVTEATSGCCRNDKTHPPTDQSAFHDAGDASDYVDAC